MLYHRVDSLMLWCYVFKTFVNTLVAAGSEAKGGRGARARGSMATDQGRAASIIKQNRRVNITTIKLGEKTLAFSQWQPISVVLMV